MLANFVDDSETLYRRFVLDNYPLDSTGKRTVSSQAFTDREMQISVDRAKLNVANSELTKQLATDGIISLIAGEIRQISTVQSFDKYQNPLTSYTVDVQPDPEENHEAHAIIIAIPVYSNEKIFRRLREALAIIANNNGVLIEPT